jgi:photosystem II stability/assembly factor-like uncharacterized protein
VNGGTSFTNETLASGWGTTWWQAICFTDNNNGYLAGDVIQKTSDGGNFWNIVLDSWIISGNLYDIMFTTTQKGYAVGEDWYNVPLLYKTSDAGYNWINVTVGSEVTQITSIESPADGLLYLGANSYSSGAKTFSKSTDDGATWTQPSFSENIYTMCFVTTLTGYVGSNAGIFKTVNGGTTWTSVLTTTSAVNSLKIKNGFGMAVCANGSIYQTTDNGATWTVMNSPVRGTSTLNTMSVVSPQSAYAAGSVGTVLKFSAPFVGIENNADTSSNAEIYPNPIKDKVNINVGENCAVTIFDQAGKQVIISLLSAGSDQVIVNDLPKGVYFFRISSGNNLITKKVIKE